NGDERSVAGRPFESLEMAESRVQLLVGLLANAARVDDDQLGVEVCFRRLIAGRLQQPRHPFGVVDVHLAAVRLDEILHALNTYADAAYTSRARRSILLSLSVRPAFAFRPRVPGVPPGEQLERAGA